VLGGTADPMSGYATRSGLVARAGAALQARIATRWYLGLGLDAEAYAIAPWGAIRSTDGGTDVVGNLHLSYELGF